ncbi:hypothetical protein GCM10010388_48200 [Streptomyces mauvecolor]
MTTDFQNARLALGARLRELRTGAGLDGKGIAERLGWQLQGVPPGTRDFEVWPRPYQVDHGEPPTSVNPLRASDSRPLEFGPDRCRSWLLVSGADVKLGDGLDVARFTYQQRNRGASLPGLGR